MTDWPTQQPGESDRDFTNRTGMTPGFPQRHDRFEDMLGLPPQPDWKAIATTLAAVLKARDQERWRPCADCGYGFDLEGRDHDPTCPWRVAMTQYQAALEAEGS